MYKEYEDWLIKFIVKHQPIDSEDVNRLIQMVACVKFCEVTQRIGKGNKISDELLVEAIDKYQKIIFKRIEPFLIVTGRN